MECTFQVGQKVVCVDTAARGDGDISRQVAQRAGAKYPEEGITYTIREIFISRGGSAAVLLAEINNLDASIAVGEAIEAGFAADRFRPVIERGTDAGMSILRDILTKTDKPVEVSA